MILEQSGLYDATHSLGTHPFGIKIDAIPGRFNFTSIIRTLIKGEHRGLNGSFCIDFIWVEGLLNAKIIFLVLFMGNFGATLFHGIHYSPQF